MGAVVDVAVNELNGRLKGEGFDGSARFVLTDEGSILIDGAGAREGEGPADVTLTASADTFQQILAGDLDATSAFMTGKLALDGDMGTAMKLAALLA